MYMAEFDGSFFRPVPSTADFKRVRITYIYIYIHLSIYIYICIYASIYLCLYMTDLD